MKNKLTLALSLLILFSICFLYSDETVRDRNNDGNPDEWIGKNSEGNEVIKTDNNYDGNIDYILEIDNIGNKIAESVDHNHDSEMDNFYYYENGVLVRQEVDSNYNGNIDIKVFLDKGIYIIRIERDKNHDGEFEYIKKY